MEKMKQSLIKTLLAIQPDVNDLRKSVTLTGQLVLLTDLEDAASSMSDLAANLDIESPADLNKYSRWSNDAVKAYGEILKTYEQFYGHMLEVAQVIDRQIDVGKIK